jgi:hypothetical protein
MEFILIIAKMSITSNFEIFCKIAQLFEGFSRQPVKFFCLAIASHTVYLIADNFSNVKLKLLFRITLKINEIITKKPFLCQNINFSSA